MKTSDFDYSLPQELIAQTPVEPRDNSRLMVIDRKSGTMEHHQFFELPEYLKAGDVMVFNDSRVIPARLFGRKVDTGGKVELLLLRRLEDGKWEALVKPGRRVKPGTVVDITREANSESYVRAEVAGVGENGVRIVSFSNESQLMKLGQIPLPPYIHTPLENPERYQTVYARDLGSVAAPTAGLHLTQDLLNAIREKGVKCLFVTLHIGLDTFRPVTEENPEAHNIHSEYGVVSKEVADELSKARIEGRRVICVGTTSVRLVEQAAQRSKETSVAPFEGWADLYILPGYRFRVVDALITNFHLPKSTLLMLVSAFAGKELIFRAYKEAIEKHYRFYSFGDAMVIV